jgi:hypothetical protein
MGTNLGAYALYCLDRTEWRKIDTTVKLYNIQAYIYYYQEKNVPTLSHTFTVTLTRFKRQLVKIRGTNTTNGSKYNYWTRTTVSSSTEIQQLS